MEHGNSLSLIVAVSCPAPCQVAGRFVFKCDGFERNLQGNMATVQIDRTEFSELKDCQVGEPLELKGTVSAIDGDTLTVDVESAAYDEEEAPVPIPDKTKPAKSPVASIGVPMRGKTYA